MPSPDTNPQRSHCALSSFFLESVLLDTMYDLPGKANVSKVVVDEGVVTGETKPYIIYESEDTQNSQSAEEESLATGSDRP